MPTICHASLFRNGRNQAIRIPREMELPGKEVLIHREGTKLIIEPIDQPPDLLELLSALTPIDDVFPDVDAGLGPLDEVRI